ncbi:FAD-dependent oxidoreductase [Acidianus sulfidivorans JP7]|uniref:FAD-binding oxidoreductase n=1 Tax=Acidianus sulfidivorans JP7 TaxID=619593 RepID=A0A2U9IKL7_9CREN|nr:FAD-dependent oxidoreductase [Acidianus sulfidivorans]AWR96536.1 FAD-dependent oxidoreductase [Acidianus sulfidivorans JP7]
MTTIVVGGGITGLLTSLKFNDSVIIESKKTYRNSYASLWSVFPPLCGNHYDECLQAETEYLNFCKDYDIICKKAHILRKAENKIGGKILSREEIKDLEPDINLEEAEYFDNGLFVEGEDLINKLSSEANIRYSNVTKINISNDTVSSIALSNGEEIKGDFYIFTASYLLQNLLQNFVTFKPYKGHLIIANTKYNLRGILIVNDRIAISGKRLYMNGDSTNTSTTDIDYTQISKTINTFKDIIDFDTTNLEIRVGFRSVSENGEPVLLNPYKNLIIVGGYKFGFALAPVLAKKVKELIKKL